MTPQEFFKNDLFAENAGVILLEVREGYSKAKLEIKPEHLNAGARTQGGAIFTLADLALAAAANSHGTLSFSLSSTITFLRASGPGDLCRSARTLYRSKYRLLSGRCNQPKRGLDCYIRIKCFQKRPESSFYAVMTGNEVRQIR